MVLVRKLCWNVTVIYLAYFISHVLQEPVTDYHYMIARFSADTNANRRFLIYWKPVPWHLHHWYWLFSQKLGERLALIPPQSVHFLWHLSYGRYSWNLSTYFFCLCHSRVSSTNLHFRAVMNQPFSIFGSPNYYMLTYLNTFPSLSIAWGFSPCIVMMYSVRTVFAAAFLNSTYFSSASSST